MGKPSTSGIELATQVQETTFTSVTAGAAIQLFGMFNMFVRGGVGTVRLERSFDGGTTWGPCSLDTSGTAAVYVITATDTTWPNIVFNEPEPGVLYRINCTAYTSGNVIARLSGGARLT